METLNRFEAVDIILEYIDRPEHHNSMFDADDIKKELFPKDHVDTVQILFELIDNCGINPPIAKLESGTWILRTVHTKHFLDDGGFTKVHKESLNKSEQKTEKENLELQQLRTDNILKTNQLADYEKTKVDLKRTTNATIVLAIIALLELVLLLINSNLF